MQIFCSSGVSHYKNKTEKVLDEVKNNLKAKFKESDLFRVYQSIDFANFNHDGPNADPGLQKAMPAMMALSRGLYSPRWRSFMEKIAGVAPGTLTDQVDCAVNCHDKGCHLLCHDDVIGTRKISYILYFTDPEPDWKNEDGGKLELYDSIEANGKKVPGVIPTKTILPTFNSMAYFVVEPGVSFHSVQEVFCDRPRLSIQGWFHAKEAPSQMEHATLSQLKDKVTDDDKGNDLEGEFIPMAKDRIESAISDATSESSSGRDNLCISPKDIEFLSEFINPTFLKPESIKEICQRFEEESSVQLRHFFKLEWEEQVSALLKKDDETCNIGRDKPSLNYSVGVSDDLIPVGPAHKQRFLEFVGEGKMKGDSCGSVLKYLKEKVMQSPEFGRLLSSYTSLGALLGYRGRVRRFRPGLDYTIAHYGILTKTSVLDATMCFVTGKGDQSLGDEGDNDDMIWQSDDKGGFECYIAADDEDDDVVAEDEYDEEDDTKLLSVSPSNNTLSLVYRDPGTMRFVKYLGIGAPSSRWDLCLEYEVEDDDDTNDASKDGNNADEEADEELVS